eukprot:CAMPEP_0174831186 /NCGR_PEP_ID=MMETSP1114-20130205/2956_1 /TAXON_ID=312471 /ORGANISM="Neobodo designis, Strain CCAP 1951/1" /LENGTH=560 /DNA_ID=CAMNT_0016065007 /DNA_START=82 /DNA_END=1764 /DNA_ORIENTATION=-
MRRRSERGKAAEPRAVGGFELASASPTSPLAVTHPALPIPRLRPGGVVHDLASPLLVHATRLYEGATPTMLMRAVVVLAALHFMLKGMLAALEWQFFGGLSANGRADFAATRHTVALAFPSTIRIVLAPLLDATTDSALARWLGLLACCVTSVMATESFLNCEGTAVVCDEEVQLPHLLGSTFALRYLIASQMVADLVVSSFLLSRPYTWLLQGPCVAVGAAIASRLPYLTAKPLAALVANLHILQLVLLAAAAVSMFLIPAHERGGRGLAADSRDEVERAERTSAMSTPFLSLRTYPVVLRAAWRTVTRRRYLLLWLVMCALIPAAYAPTRLRMNADASWAGGEGTNSAMFALLRGIINAVFFVFLQNKIAFTNSTTFALWGYLAIFTTVALCPDDPGASLAGAGVWLFLDAIFGIYVSAQAYACFAVAARLGGGTCAVSLFAVQQALIQAGETASTEVALWLADWFSSGCTPHPNRIRRCDVDALPTVTLAMCGVGALSGCVGWYMAFAQFDLAGNPHWGDAGHAITGARRLLFSLALFYVATTVVTAYMAFTSPLES